MLLSTTKSSELVWHDQGFWTSWVNSYLVLREVAHASEMSVQYWVKSSEMVACETVGKGKVLGR